MDSTEFVRICQEELRRAHAFAGSNLPTNDVLYAICEDMWLGLPKQIKPSMLKELFRVARANYAKVPDLNALRKAWDNHLKPNEMPAPKDAPRLAPPTIANDEANWRKLAAVRTALAEGGYMKSLVKKIGADYERHLEGEEWMKEYLKLPPCLEEVRAFVAAVVGLYNDRTRLGFYIMRQDVAPHWGKYIMEYGL